MRKNVLRELLNEGKPTLSTRMITTAPQIIELIGLSGAFDFIELCGEYTAWTLPDLETFARTIELFPHMTSMMKVEKGLRLFVAQRALGAGIQNILFADCDTAEEARECVRYVRPLTPEDGGLNGCGMYRNIGYLLESGSEAWVQAMRDVVVEVMIESAKAMENLDEILSVKGIDMVHFGPCDYSLTAGKAGQKGSPEVKRKQREMIEKALRKGVRPRVIINSCEAAKEYIDMGVRDFCIGNDLNSIYSFCKSNGEKMRELMANNLT